MNKGLRTIPDQIATVTEEQPFPDKRGVVGIHVPEQRPLDPPFAITGDVYLLHRLWINSCMVHRCRPRHRRRGEILHLFGCKSSSPDIACEIDHIRNCASWMRTDPVRDQVLFLLVEGLIFLKNPPEILKGSVSWLVHQFQHMRADMFGCHLQLAGDMVVDEFP